MESLPSYHEATTGPTWLQLIAPYVPVASWPACCLVSRQFHRQFASRLWQDPLVTVRQLGLHPNDDLIWYRRLINKHVKVTRHETRRLVRALDFRDFALSASGLYSTEASERAISESFRHLPQIFPNLICLLVDGHPELDPSSLATSRLSSSDSLELLDLARCRQELTPKLFSSDVFRNLVYLDVSHVPGSLRSAIQSSLNPQFLPELRVLKARGREVDDRTASLLFRTFGLQLWSLDLGNNKLTDNIIDDIAGHCFSSVSFRTDAHFEKEGKLVLPRNIGSRNYGPFEFLEESEVSALYIHPERHLADAPIYSRRGDHSELQEWQVVRSNGLAPLKRDDVNTTKLSLLNGALAVATGSPGTVNDIRLRKGGITHLHLSENNFTSHGIEKLLRITLGRLEHFECDSSLCTLVTTSQEYSAQRLRISGLLGSAHLFRPVVSSNLQSLRVHHSLVTRVPSLAAEGLSLVSAIRLAEGPLFSNIRRACPLGFEPDMNSRVASLTLTHIPARSTGPIIEQLIRFLDLASSQQRDIRRAMIEFSSRGPSVLRGLQHLRLELDPDFSEEDCFDSLDEREVDLDKLLDPGDEYFSKASSSLFGDESRGITSRSSAHTKKNSSAPGAELHVERPYEFAHWTSGRLKSAPYSDTNLEYVNHRAELSSSWTGNIYTVAVWIGTGTIGPHAAVNEYMWNLQDPRLRSDVGPATPNHVAAGVPSGSYIFYAAWDAMVPPRDLQLAVRNLGTARLRDVASAIKEYRLKKRGTPDHWEGKIELVRTAKTSRYHSSEYWR
ncbi:hypothetical protein F5X96DRAFT_317714 [Biscogniauxia mediterranea]|nr:hypothetical protein F5X96DRAFT_317714 [Biscogniauxia mediterranea]